MSAAPPRPNPTIPPLAWLLLSASLVIVLLWFLAARGYWEDDAYIHLEFARSLAAGKGFAFNGHVVYGDTSPLWVWLLVAAHALVPVSSATGSSANSSSTASWLLAGKLLTVVAAAFALSGVYVYARSLVRRQHVAVQWHPAAANVFAATMVLAFVLSPYFGYWAFSGMEALAAAGLACWTCLLIAPRHLRWQRVLLAAALAGLAPLLRPEMAFFTLLVGCVLLQRIRQMHGSLAARVDTLLAALVLAAAPAIAWALYARHTFGSVLPNTNAAKRAAPADSVLLRLLHLYAFGYPVTLIACLLLAVWIAVYYARPRPTDAPHRSPLAALHAGGWLLFLWTGLSAAFYLLNHTFVQTRYLFVTAPVLTVAVLALAAVRWPRVYRGLLALTLGYGMVISLLATRPLLHNKVVIDATTRDLASYIATLPPQAPVAIYAIGETAFLAQHPLIDTGGITRPGVIPYIHDADDTRILHWIYSQGARYQVIDHAPLPGAQRLWSRDAPETGWFYNPQHYSATGRIQLWTLPPPAQTTAPNW